VSREEEAELFTRLGTHQRIRQRSSRSQNPKSDRETDIIFIQPYYTSCNCVLVTLLLFIYIY